MKTSRLLALTAGVLFSGVATASAAPDPVGLYIVHLTTGSSWAAGKKPSEQPGFGEHGRNMKRLRDKGDIVMGARYGDTGMLVMKGTSIDAVREEMARDPGVKAGSFVFTVDELRPFYPGCVPPVATPNAE